MVGHSTEDSIPLIPVADNGDNSHNDQDDSNKSWIDNIIVYCILVI